MCLDGDDAAAFGIAGAAPEAVALGISPFAGPQYHGCTAFGTNWRRICIPCIELEEGADQDQSLLGVLDQFFKKVIGCTGIEELGHGDVLVDLFRLGSP